MQMYGSSNVGMPEISTGHPHHQPTEEDMSNKVKVTFLASVPDGLTREQIEAWVAFELRASNTLSHDSPLYRESLSAVPGSVEVDHG
jgi:hypothetical protein